MERYILVERENWYDSSSIIIRYFNEWLDVIAANVGDDYIGIIIDTHTGNQYDDNSDEVKSALQFFEWYVNPTTKRDIGNYNATIKRRIDKLPTGE